MEMVRAGLGYLAAADATAMAAETQAQCLRMLEQAHCDGHRGADLGPGRVHLRPGVFRGCGLQPAGVADQPDPGSPRAPRSAYTAWVRRAAGASGGRGGAGRGGDVGVLRADDP